MGCQSCQSLSVSQTDCNPFIYRCFVSLSVSITKFAGLQNNSIRGISIRGTGLNWMKKRIQWKVWGNDISSCFSWWRCSSLPSGQASIRCWAAIYSSGRTTILSEHPAHQVWPVWQCKIKVFSVYSFRHKDTHFCSIIRIFAVKFGIISYSSYSSASIWGTGFEA